MAFSKHAPPSVLVAALWQFGVEWGNTDGRQSGRLQGAVEMGSAIESLVRVATAGGSVVVSGNYEVDGLVRVAMALKTKGQGTLTIKTSNAAVDSMVRIAMAAPGQVVFDLT
ncbi:hypothetical protein [Pseudomonas sp. MWU13-3659]|uniref:hypothetical protein n=1 Tax=Pseudomonas sp. MWU13-3659 TaxID=2986964 RepID=UPI002074DCCF|nr:hypothetical protein [Pseudomonas sp. MWU13-3659]